MAGEFKYCRVVNHYIVDREENCMNEIRPIEFEYTEFINKTKNITKDATGEVTVAKPIINPIKVEIGPLLKSKLKIYILICTCM